MEDNQRELDRLKPFEAEVKEKAALLGKTRHEGPQPSPHLSSEPNTDFPAVILNEHLTKALRLLKRASPSSTVDKLVMTNFLLQFLSLPREDTKRYEILNLISSLLEWNDEQRQKAGLARQTTPANFRRSSSNPILHDIPASPGDRKEVPYSNRCEKLIVRVCLSCGLIFCKRRRRRGRRVGGMRRLGR